MNKKINIEEMKRYLKRSLKNKVRITTSLVMLFLMTNTLGMASYISIDDGKVGAGRFDSQAKESVALNGKGNEYDVAREKVAEGSIAIGHGSMTKNDDNNDKFDAKYSVAIGYNAKSRGFESVSVGKNSESDGEKSVAIGFESKVHGDRFKLIEKMADKYEEYKKNGNPIINGFSNKEEFKNFYIYGKKEKGDNSLDAGQGVAIGSKATAAGQATSIGNDTYALGRSSIAIGNDDNYLYRQQITEYDYANYFKGLYDNLYTQSDQKGKYGFNYDGTNRRTDSNEANRIWSPTLAVGHGAIAIGSRSLAYGSGSVAFGTMAYALKYGSTAIGSETRAEGVGAIAVGRKTNVFSSESVSIGNETTVLEQGGMAYGFKAYSGGQGSIAIGTEVYSNVDMDYNKSFEINNVNGLHQKVAPHDIPSNGKIDNKKAESAYQFDLNGVANSAPDNKYLESGEYFTDYNGSGEKKGYIDKLEEALTKEENGKRLSLYANTKEKNGVKDVIQSSGKNSIVIGSLSAANGNNSLALGRGAFGRANNAFAIGSYSYALKENSMAFGVASRSLSKNALAFGTGAGVDTGSEYSLSLGVGAVVKKNAKNSMAFGTGTRVEDNTESGLAIGYKSYTNMKNSVALGVESKTDYKKEDLNKQGWTPKGVLSIPTTEKTGVISVGSSGAERRIINVASGYKDSDAANVGQLKALEQKINQSGIADLIDGDNEIDSGLHYLSVNKQGDRTAAIKGYMQRQKDYNDYVEYKSKYLEALARKKRGDNLDESYVNELKTKVEELEAKAEKEEKDGGYKGKTYLANSQLKNLNESAMNEATTNFDSVINKINSAKKNDKYESNGTTLKNILTSDEKKEIDDSNFTNKGAIGKDSIALGYETKAMGDKGIAIGTGDKRNKDLVKLDKLGDSDPTKQATQNKAIRSDENLHTISKASSVAVGMGAIADDWSVAVGGNTNTGDSAVAVGDRAKAVGSRSIALGHRAVAGRYFELNGKGPLNNILPGSATEDIIGAVGYEGARNGVAIGNHATATSDNSIAIGYDAKTGDDNKQDMIKSETGFDYGTKRYILKKYFSGKKESDLSESEKTQFKNYEKNYAVLSEENKRYILNKYFKGKSEDDLNETEKGQFEKYQNSTKFYKYTVKAGADNAIAFGKKAHAKKNDSIAFGVETVAEKEKSVAIGNKAKASGKQAVVIGSGNDGNNNTTETDVNANISEIDGKESAVAIGNGVKSNNYAVGIGGNIVAGDTAVAIGDRSRATGKMSIAIGEKAKATSENAISFGNESKAESQHTIALGKASSSTQEAAVAIGKDAKASFKDSVAIGAGSQATESKAKAYLTEDVSNDGRTFAVGSDSIKRRITGVADGAADSDAATVGQLKLASKPRYLSINEDGKKNLETYGAYLEALKKYVEGKNGSNKDALKQDLDKKKQKVKDFIEYTIGNEKKIKGEYKDIEEEIKKNDFDNKTQQQVEELIKANEKAQKESNYFSDQAKGEHAIAQGFKAKANGRNSVAIGTNANAADLRSIVVGSNSTSNAQQAIIIGSKSEITSGSNDSIIVGNKAKIASQIGLALGSGVEIGTNSNNSVVIGNSSKIAGNSGQSSSIGYNVNVKSSQAIGLGNDVLVEANSRGAVAIGSDDTGYNQGNKENGGSNYTKTKAEGAAATAIAAHAQAKGKAATAIGARAFALSEESTALGVSSKVDANSNQSTAIGYQTSVQGKHSIAIGRKASVTDNAQAAIAIGTDDSGYLENNEGNGSKWKANKASGKASTAIGAHSEALAEAATALGARTTASGKESLAFGANAVANKEGGVALGSYAVADRETNGSYYNILTGSKDESNKDAYKEVFKNKVNDTQKNNMAKLATKSSVSIGDTSKGITRQLTGIAAGSEDTDAVNVWQLKETRAYIEGKKINILGDNNSTETNNKPQLSLSGTIKILGREGKNTNGKAEEWNSKNDNHRMTVENIETFTKQDGDGNVQILVGMKKSPKFDTIKLGINGNIELGESNGALNLGNGLTGSNTTRKIINVTAGTADTDVANYGQVKKATEKVVDENGNDKLIEVSSADGENGLGKTYTVKATDKLKNKLKEIDNKANSTDLNSYAKKDGSNLNGISEDNKKAWATGIGTNTISDSATNETSKLVTEKAVIDYISSKKLKFNTDLGNQEKALGETIDIIGGETDNKDWEYKKDQSKPEKTDYSSKNVSTKVENGKVLIGLKKNVEFDSVTFGDNGPKLSKNNNGNLEINSKKLVGLAEGAISSSSTDAITGKQLNDFARELESTDITITKSNATNGGQKYTLKLSDATNNKINNKADKSELEQYAKKTLENIDDAGKTKIKGLINVKKATGSDNILEVTKSTSGDAKEYTLSVKDSKVKELAKESVEVKSEDGSISVTADKTTDSNKTIYKLSLDGTKIKELAGTTDLETKYAKVDGSNITGNESNWRTKLDLYSKSEVNTKIESAKETVTNDGDEITVNSETVSGKGNKFKVGLSETFKQKVEGKADKTDLASYAKVGLDNITDSGKKVIKDLINVSKDNTVSGTDENILNITGGNETNGQAKNYKLSVKKSKITEIAKEAAKETVEVSSDTNSGITVTPETNGDKKNYKLSLDEAKIKEIAGTTDLSTTYAKVDGSNVKGLTEDNRIAWANGIGTSTIQNSTKGILVTDTAVKNYVDTRKIVLGADNNTGKDIILGETFDISGRKIDGKAEGWNVTNSQGKDGRYVTDNVETFVDKAANSNKTRLLIGIKETPTFKDLTLKTKDETTNKIHTVKFTATDGSLTLDSKKISGVLAGTEDTDAVNKGQLNAVENKITTLEGNTYNKTEIENKIKGATEKVEQGEGIKVTESNGVAGAGKTYTVALADGLKAKIDGALQSSVAETTYAKVGLDNINTAGKNIIKNLIDVTKETISNDENILDVTKENENGDNAKNFKLSVKKSKVAGIAKESIGVEAKENNNGIEVTKDTSNGKDTYKLSLNGDKIKELAGTTNIATEYAKVDASNITGKEETWRTKLNVDSKSEVDTKVKGAKEKVTAGTGIKVTEENGANGEGKNYTVALSDDINTKINKITNIETTLNNKLDNVTLTSNDSSVTITDSTQANSKSKTFDLKVNAQGQINDSDNKAVSGKTVYDYIQTIKNDITNNKNKLSDFATKKLNNITDEGKKVIKDLINVSKDTDNNTNDENILNITGGNEADGQAKNYKLSVKKSKITEIAKEAAKESVTVSSDNGSGITVTSEIKGEAKNYKLSLDGTKIKELAGTTDLANKGIKFGADNSNGNLIKLNENLDILGHNSDYTSKTWKQGLNTIPDNQKDEYSSDNISTYYENNKIYVGIKEKPTFKELTIKDETNSVNLKATSGALTLDNKRISGVSNGINDEDAVNMNQLNAVKEALENTKVISSDNSVQIAVGESKTDKSKTFDLKVKTDGTITESDEKAVSGKTVHQYVQNEISKINNSVASTKLKLSNGTDNKELNIKDETLEIDGGTNTKVTLSDDTASKKKKFAVDLKDDISVKSITLTNESNGNKTTTKLVTGEDGRIHVTSDTENNETKKGYNSTLATTDDIKNLSDSQAIVYVDESGNKLIKRGENFYKKANGKLEKITNTSKIYLSTVDEQGQLNKPMQLSNIKNTLGDNGYTINSLLSESNTKKLSNAASLKDLQEVAKSGIIFTGDNTDEVKVPLGNKLNIVGEGNTTLTDTAENNINVHADKTNKKLVVKLAKNLVNMNSIEFKKGDKSTKISITNEGDLQINNNTIITTKNIVDQTLDYKANGDTTSKKTKLSEGLDFTNGDNTTAVVEDKGVVKFNLNKDIKDITSITFKEGDKNASIRIDKKGNVIITKEGNKHSTQETIITTNNIGSQTISYKASGETNDKKVRLDKGLTFDTNNSKYLTSATEADGKVKFTLKTTDSIDYTKSNDDSKNDSLTTEKAVVDYVDKKVSKVKKNITNQTLTLEDSSNKETKVNLKSDKIKYGNGINTKATIEKNGNTTTIKYDINNDLKGITSISKDSSGQGSKITLNDNDITINSKKLKGLADGEISDTSTDAITGKQLNAIKNQVGSIKQFIKYQGDAGSEQTLNLGETLNMVGEGNTTPAQTAENNISVDTTDSKKITLKLAKHLTNMGSITFKEGDKTSKISITNEGDLQVNNNTILTTNNIGNQTIAYKSGTTSKTTTLTTGFDFNSTDLDIKAEDNGKLTFNLKSDIKDNLNGKGKDGRDGKNGTNGNDGAGSKGLTGKDGLNGKDNTDKINAVRNGEAGIVVYTDASGNRLVKANDGKYYKQDLVKADGTVKTKAENGNKDVNASDNVKATLVNTDGSTSLPTTVLRIGNGNIAKGSYEAVTGDQLHTLSEFVGLKTKDNGTFDKDNSTITALHTYTNSEKPKSILEALNKATENLNAGLTFEANFGQNDNANSNKFTKKLGESVNILASNTVDGILQRPNKDIYTGDNLATYVNGNKMYIGMKQDSKFKSLIIGQEYGNSTKDGKGKISTNDKGLQLGYDNANITISKDDTKAKISGLKDNSVNDKTYGAEGTVATQKEVKELLDKVNSDKKASFDNQAIVYTDGNGNKLIRENGKFYKVNGNLREEIKKDKVYLATVDESGKVSKPMTLANIKNTLGEAGYNVEKLLSEKDTKVLSRASSIKDLQELAKEGITIQTDNGSFKQELGKTLNILAKPNGNLITTVDNGKVYLMMKEDPKFKSINISGNTISSEKGTLKLSDDKGNAVGITNLKDGVNDTDAVNLRQLKAKIESEKNRYVSINGNIQGKDSNYNNDGAKGYASVAIGMGAKANATGSIALGSSSVATEKGSLNIDKYTVDSDEVKNKLTKEDLEALKKATTELEKRKILSKYFATMGALSIGDEKDGITRRITNVASGIKDTDAVNMLQLKNLQSNGLTFMGNSGTELRTPLGGVVNIVGEGNTTPATTAKNNISVHSNGKNLELKLADNLQNINSITSKENEYSKGKSKVKLNHDSVTIEVQQNGKKVGTTTKIDKDGINFETEKVKENVEVFDKVTGKKETKEIEVTKGKGKISGLADLNENSAGHMAANKNYVDKSINEVTDKINKTNTKVTELEGKISKNETTINNIENKVNNIGSTLDKGYTFKGNKGQSTKKLGDSIGIVGGATLTETFTEDNTGSVIDPKPKKSDNGKADFEHNFNSKNVVTRLNEDGNVEIAISKDLKGMRSFETEKDKEGNQTIINQNSIEFKNNGKTTIKIDSKNKTITGVVTGKTSDSVVTKGYVDEKIEKLNENKPFEYFEKTKDSVFGSDGKMYPKGTVFDKDGKAYKDVVIGSDNKVYDKDTKEIDGKYFKESDKVTKQADGKYYTENEIKDKKYDEKAKKWLDKDGKPLTAQPTEASEAKALTDTTAKEQKPIVETKLVRGKDNKFYTEEALKDATYDETNKKYTKNGTDVAAKDPSDVIIKAMPNSKAMTLGNIGAGRIEKGSTDAINGGQLHEELAKKLNVDGSNIDQKKFAENASKGADISKPNNVLVTDTQVSEHLTKNYYNKKEINTMITNVDKKADIAIENSTLALGGVANAVAMANLVQVSSNSTHRHSLSAAYGYYGKSHALAIGFSGINKENNFVYKLSGSVNNQGNLALGIGAGVMLGETNDYKERKDTNLMKKELDEVKSKLEKANSEIAEYKKEQKATNDRLKDLEAKLEKLLKKGK